MDIRAADLGLIGAVIGILAMATAAGQVLRRQPQLGLNAAAVASFNARVRGGWVSCSLLVAAYMLPYGLTVAVFGFISWWALREFITLTPTRRGDHRALFWVLWVITPVQSILVSLDGSVTFEDGAIDFDNSASSSTFALYSTLIPVYAFLFVPARVAMAGDYKRFLERVAKIQCGLMICVYCLSHAPALLYLRLEDAQGKPWTGNPAGLLLFFIVMVQVADTMQYVWGRIYGRRLIAPMINTARTWEGFLIGTGCAALIGMSLWWATPFSWLQAAGMSVLLSVMASAGGLTMSAIKRDRGVRDYGTLVEGHGGVLDRIDAICFAAPIFYHVTRFFFA